ncbi:MAG: tetratricopeptide repeat protein [Pyrinomonadaceae bacterium]
MRLSSFLILLALGFSSETVAQDDEVRQGSGLPMQIGDNVRAGDRMNVSGRIAVEGSKNLKRAPVISVTVTYAGAAAEKAIANDEGYFLVRNVPRNNVGIVVEIDGVEVLRQPIIAPPMGNPRFDYTVAWPPANSQEKKPGVIMAEQGFIRAEKNEAIYRQAVAALKNNDTASAVNLFDRVLAAESQDFVSWTDLGTAYFKANSLDNAEACYFKAIELKKDYLIALLNLGKLYLLKKQYDNAVLVLSNAVKSAPTSPDTHQYLGEAYLQSKKGAAALYHFDEALRLAPDDKAELHLRIAALYDAAKMKDKAAKEYKAFLVKRPNYPEKNELERYVKENLLQ